MLTVQQKREKLKLLIQLERIKCKDNLFYFFQRAWKILEPNTDLNLNWHHQVLCDVLQEEFFRWKRKERKKHDLIINVPPRSTKSLIISVIFPVWCWIHQPSTRFITASNSVKLCDKHSQDSKNVIKSEWFQELFGHLFIIRDDMDAKSFWGNDHTGYRRTATPSGTITGDGCNIFIYDDLMDANIANKSQAERINALEWYKNASFSRLNDQSIDFRIVVEQRIHEFDLTGYILATRPDEIKHICLPAELTDKTTPEYREYYTDGYLWPNRLGQRELSAQRTTLGTYGYAAQFLQAPSPLGGGIIKKAWFEIISWARFLEMVPEEFRVWNFFMDTAYTKDQSNDPSAIGSMTYYNNFMFIRYVQTVYLEFPELCKFVSKFTSEHGYNRRSKIYVEPKASGKSLVQQMKVTTSLNIITGKAPTTDKVARANSCTPFLEAGRCFLIEGMWNEPYLEELSLFPNGADDDRVDITTMAVDYYNAPKKRGGMGVR